MIHCEYEIRNEKPGIVLIVKERNLQLIVDTACPHDNNVGYEGEE